VQPSNDRGTSREARYDAPALKNAAGTTGQFKDTAS
jgi:hypothetical protein